jgi:hypothetical protein
MKRNGTARLFRAIPQSRALLGIPESMISPGKAACGFADVDRSCPDIVIPDRASTGTGAPD